MDKSVTIPKLYNVLQQEASLYKNIVSKTVYLQTLDRQIKAYLPPNLSAVCWVVNAEGAVLTLGAETSTYTARLRYALPELQRKIEQDNASSHFTTIRCKTILSTQKPQSDRVKKSRQPISTEGSDAIDALGAVVADPKLRMALQHFGRHIKDKKND